MNRRTCFQTMFAASASAAAQSHASAPIELHVDLAVDPVREKEMLHAFYSGFQPTAAKQPGFIEVKMLKLRSTLQGRPPAGANYQFVIAFRSEELRQKWVASADHQRVWPLIERTLSSKDYTIVLYDIAT